jgi:hypothetical protein
MEKLRVRPRGWGRIEIVDRLSRTYGLQFFGKTKGEHGVGVEAEKGGIGMVVDGASGPLRDSSGVPDMIPVTVGKKEGVRFEFFCFKEIEKALRRIDGKKMAVEIEEMEEGDEDIEVEEDEVEEEKPNKRRRRSSKRRRSGKKAR